MGLRSYPSAEKQSVYSTAPSDWATGNLSGEFYPSAEMQFVYSTALAAKATGHLKECYPSPEMQSVYSTAPADRATGHLLGEFYPSAEKQSVYSTAPVDWTIYTVREKLLWVVIEYDIYIYIGSISSLMQILLNIIDILCLHIFFWIRSNSRITFIVFGGNWFRHCP